MATTLTGGRRKPVLVAVIAMIAVVMTAASARAQGMGGFVGAAFTGSKWTVNPVDEGSPSTMFANTTVDSSVVGVSAQFGWRLTRQHSVAVEVDIPSRRDLTQTSDYQFGSPHELESLYREMTILAIVRHRLFLEARSHLELVAGFGINRASSLQRIAFPQFPSLAFGPLGAEEDVTHIGLAGAVGADFEIHAARHLSVVPQFRVLVVPHGSVRNGGTFPSFGLNTVVYRFGIGIRVPF
jgi:hypothetical protein